VKYLDRLLQRMRIGKAARYIPPGCRLLDIGCADGALFRQLSGRIAAGCGLDPGLAADGAEGQFKLIRGTFPEALPDSDPFDVITLLAVMEHIPRQEHRALATAIASRLKPGGKLIITVPSPLVEHILAFLRAVRLISGMALEEHYGFDVTTVAEDFAVEGMELVVHRRFELGLNHLFVFRRGGGEGR